MLRVRARVVPHVALDRGIRGALTRRRARVVRTDRSYRFFAVFLAAFFAAFFAMVPPGMWLLSFGLCVRVSQQVG